MATPTKEVFLQDAETQQVYSIFVTIDEAKRLEKDIVFATQKLQEAKKTLDNSNTDTTGCDNTIHDDSLNSSEEVIGVFKWPHEAILLLIEEYSIRQNDFVSGKMSQKKVWSVIAQEMMKKGYNVTGPQCLSKFSGLKRTYKAVKDHNNKSGNGTRSWPYFSHLDTLLGSKPYMSPIATVSSTGKRTISESEASTSSSIDSCIDMDDPTSKTSTSKHKKFRQANTMEQLIKDLKEERQIAENAVERRHKENCDLRERLLNTLDKMVDILAKK